MAHLSTCRSIIRYLLQESITKKDLCAARHVYSLIVKTGLDLVSFYGDHLIRLLSSCGSFSEAHHVFIGIRRRSVYTWHAVISAATKVGDGTSALVFYHQMLQEGLHPDKYVYTCCLKAYGLVDDMQTGMAMHGTAVKVGLDSAEAVGSSLIDMYTMCNRIDDACRVLEISPLRDSVSWDTLIFGCVQQSDGSQAIALFHKMLEEGMEPTKVTCFSVLKACIITGSIGFGMKVHGFIIANKIVLDSKVSNNLINMYASAGNMDDAYNIFITMPNKDIVSWCAIVGAYAENDCVHIAFDLFTEMCLKGVLPDKVTFLCVLKACGNERALRFGRLIHDFIVQLGIIVDVEITNTLLDMYAKCGNIIEACRLFDQLPNPTSVSCGAMIAGYAQSQNFSLAMDVYKYMKKLCLEPTIAAYISILQACQGMGVMGESRIIHSELIKRGLEMDLMVGNTLLDVYCKCGYLSEAFTIFEGMLNPNVISCGIIITAHVEHGDNLLALACFENMLKEGNWPDKVTCLGILRACSCVGALKQGQHIHYQVVMSGLEQDQAISSCLIEMYCKCGGIAEACKIFTDLDNRDIGLWGVMIAGCGMYGYYDLAEEYHQIMKHQGLEPNDQLTTSILCASNHVGILDFGHAHFEIIYDSCNHCVEHYSCLIDILGRLGYLQEAMHLFETMPSRPNVVSWTGLLSSSNIYGEMWLGNRCFDHNVQPMPSHGFLRSSECSSQDNYVRRDFEIATNGITQA